MFEQEIAILRGQDTVVSTQQHLFHLHGKVWRIEGVRKASNIQENIVSGIISIGEEIDVCAFAEMWHQARLR